MAIRTEKSLIHWNYFLALESDLANVSRYIEFTEDNFSTYSIELSHLLLASASEVDVVAKGICKFLEPETRAGDIRDYRRIITEKLPEFGGETIYVPRFNLAFEPWSNWQENRSPDWWLSYNDVKHHRSEHFAKANLQNVLNSIGGLLISVFYYYKLKLKSEGGFSTINKDITNLLFDASGFMKLRDEYYYEPITWD